MVGAVGDGEGRQELVGLKGVAAELEACLLFETGHEMVGLPELFGGEAGTGDKGARDSKADKEFAAADGIGIFRRGIGGIGFGGAHINI
jgi:hypothetical protein